MDTLTWPVDTEDGRPMIVTLRRDVEPLRSRGRHNIRMEVTWTYGRDGMPTEALGESMGLVTDALEASFRRDPVAIITGMYTGAGMRRWIIYTSSVHIFQRKLNEALAKFPDTFPLTFGAYEDPEWEEYQATLDALPASE